jgi:transposase
LAVVCRGGPLRIGLALPQQVPFAGFANGTRAARHGAKPQGGDKRSQRIEAYRDAILAAIEGQDDITLVELAEFLRAEHGAVFAPSTIWRFLDRHSMTLKKNGARQRAGSARRTRAATRLVQGPA